MPRSDASDALPLELPMEPETVSLDLAPDAEVPLDMPEPAVPVPLETEPEPVAPPLGALVVPPETDGLAVPVPLDPMLGVAVEGLAVPGTAGEAVGGEALGLPLILAWAIRLQRSKSAWLGDDVWAWARVPAASRLPAESRAATCLTVIK